MQIGITENTADTFIQSVSIKRVAGFNVKRKLADGTPGPAHAGDFRHEIEIERLGSSGESAGAALALSLASIEGGATHVKSSTHEQKFGDVDTIKDSATHWPDATREEA